MLGFRTALAGLTAMRSPTVTSAIADLRNRSPLKARLAVNDCGRLVATLQCANLLYELDQAEWLRFSQLTLASQPGDLHPVEDQLFTILGRMFPISDMNEENLLNFEGDAYGLLIESDHPFPDDDEDEEWLYECLRSPRESFGREMSLPVFLKLIDMWNSESDVWDANADYFGWPDMEPLPLFYGPPDNFDSEHWRRLLKRRGWLCVDAVRRVVTHDTGNVFYDNTYYDGGREFVMTLDSVRMLEAQWAAAAPLRREMDEAKYLVQCQPKVIDGLNKIFRKSFSWAYYNTKGYRNRTLAEIFSNEDE